LKRPQIPLGDALGNAAEDALRHHQGRITHALSSKNRSVFILNKTLHPVQIADDALQTAQQEMLLKIKISI
jgi:hypothetical protein